MREKMQIVNSEKEEYKWRKMLIVNSEKIEYKKKFTVIFAIQNDTTLTIFSVAIIR